MKTKEVEVEVTTTEKFAVKDCPYCSSIDDVKLGGSLSVAYIQCAHCGLCGPQGVDATEAITLWNKLPRKEEA